MFAAWLDKLDAGDERVALALAESRERDWQEIVASLGSSFALRAVHDVIARAHELLARSPRVAQKLARLALRMTRSLDKDGSIDLPLIEGDAWRECASAHLEMREFVDAQEAIACARACYERSDAAEENGAVLSLIEGVTLHRLRRPTEALAAVDAGSRLLLELGASRKKYVHARTIYAGILLGTGDAEGALNVFNEAAELAMQGGDKETLAYILCDLGICATRIDDTIGAKRCFDSALKYFEVLGLTSEIPHVRKGLVTLLKNKGRYNEAISELFKSRSELLSLGMPVAAALTALEIVELLPLCGRSAHVAPLCAEMIERFTAARLQKNMLMALAYVNDVAQQHKLAASDLIHVAAFFEQAQNDPDRKFIVPS